MAIKARPAVPGDSSGIALLKRKLVSGPRDPATYCGTLSPEWLMENSALALTATDSASDEVVGFISLYSIPTHRYASPLGKLADDRSEWLSMEVAENGHLAAETSYIKMLFVSPKCAQEATKQLLKMAFTYLSACNTIVFPTSAELPKKEMQGVLSCFTFLSQQSNPEGLWVYTSARDRHLPHLTVRSAVVDDHDNLLPVLQRGMDRYPAFSQLPNTVDPGSEFALARVIDSQDDYNLVVVAESEGKMVGMMVCTANLELETVNKAFDLHAYDNLLPPELYEQQVATVKDAVIQGKRDVEEAQLKARTEQRVAERAEENERRRVIREEFIQKYEDDYAVKQLASEEEAKQKAKIKGKRAPKVEPLPKEPPPPEIPQEIQDLGPDKFEEPPIEVDAAEEEVRAAMLSGEYPVPESSTSDQLCFACIVYCLDDEYESLAQDMLAEAFSFFSSKDYCLVMLPHDSRVPSMLWNFTRIPSNPNTKFPEQLYIFHRFGLIRSFEVRLAAAEDEEGIQELTAGMSNQQEVMESFATTLEKESAVVALVDRQIVGLATLILGVNLDLLQSNFILSSRIQMNEISEESHSEVDMVIINPIFSHRKRDLLSGCLQLLSCSVLFYALPPGIEKPDVLTEFFQVPGRSRLVAEEEAFALYCFTRRLSHVQREVVNSQVVVVGASECGISMVEQLLCSPELEFTSIRLVAPGGITVGGAGSSYSSEDISKIGLEAQVTVLDAEMVGLDREEQVVYLSDGSTLNYEKLVLTTGLQDQALKKINRSNVIDAPVVTIEELVSELEEGFASGLTDCIVYGATMEAYQAMEVLVARGCPMASITHMLPPEGHLGPSLVVPALAKKIGLSLPVTEIMTLVSLEGVQDGSMVEATFTTVNASTMESIILTRTTQLLVMADAKDIDISLFECINGASLVYDGRLVVNGAFETNDPSILAGGTIARFSRSLALDVNQEFYNSKEVGCCLAESLCRAYGAANVVHPEKMPKLGIARVVGADLPSGGSIIYAGTPALIAHPNLEATLDGKKVSTLTDNGYCQLIFDENQLVQSFVYAGPLQVDGAKYQGIIGISAKYLNDILVKYECGMVPDLLEFLNMPWARLFQHDGFFGLRSSLLSSAGAMYDSKGDNVPIRAMTVDVVLAFVKAHLSELPEYHIPHQPIAPGAE